MTVSVNLSGEAKSLIRQAWGESDVKFGFGSFSGAIYDSAWVSMIIQKQNSNDHHWLFSECFQYLLATQAPDGSWNFGTSQTDTILNTATSLLSLKRHLREPIQLANISRVELQKRIISATTALQSQLDSWDFASSHQVYFEVLVPAILRYLEDEGVIFHFPAKGELMDLNKAKLSAFQPELLYGKSANTFIQSLEAFIGQINFDRVAHHKTKGSMMASPSSSAAYLMNATEWDKETEDYLSHVVRTHVNGSVPTVFPSTYFDYTTILTTLLRGGFSSDDMACHELNMITKALREAYNDGGGVIGFESHVIPNVDDTAKGIVLLSMLSLGQDIGLEAMIKYFGAGTHFHSMSGKPPVFTANCNALLAFLHHKDTQLYSSQILQLVEYLCDCWWSADSSIQDKRHLGRIYPRMLLVQAFSDLLALLDCQVLPDMCNRQLKAKVSVSVFQACHRTLLEQKKNGSWGDCPDETACGVLTLSECRYLSFLESVGQVVNDAMAAGIKYLQSLPSFSLSPGYLWNEKVTSGSQLLTLSFILAATKSAEPISTPTKRGTCLNGTYSMNAKSFEHISLFKQTPMFNGTPEWEMTASCLEGALYQPLLREHRLDIFPRENMSEDKYFDIIPFTWTACNNHLRVFASSSFLYDMMVISYLNYQADEFMEAVAGPCFGSQIEELNDLVDALVSRNLKATNYPDSYQHVIEPLSRFVAHVLDHPLVTAASRWDQQRLQRELRLFLIAHAQQAKDSSDLPKRIFHRTAPTFFNWVRTTSADHTSCPYSFSFVSCLLSGGSGQGGESFPTANLKYFGEAACRHLASMCRMYNDYGSVSRDALEGNLNSVDFPEFDNPGLLRVDLNPGGVLQAKKNALFELAEYERGCLNEALVRLQEAFKCVSRTSNQRRVVNRDMEIWRMFCNITDLYGQIYCVRDIASRMSAGPLGNNSICAEKKGSTCS
ncbi:terpene synthase family protein [Xylaria digitata]|nr:terpene synthase family protein [Xylaria digitata]